MVSGVTNPYVLHVMQDTIQRWHSKRRIKMSSVVDTGRCFECQIEVDMTEAVADPNGNPLCRDCFNILVRAGHNKQDSDDLV